MLGFFSDRFNQNWNQEGDSSENDELEDRYQKMLSDLQDQSKNISNFTESEKIFANLLVKSDFTKEEISEIMEYDPNEEQMHRINTLVERAKNRIPTRNNFVNPYSTTTLLF